MFYESRLFSAIFASQILGENSSIAVVLLLDFEENCSALPTRYLFNGPLARFCHGH
jgi:hypothetical protein